MTTLYASIIRLYALHDGFLDLDTGQWANAAFYNLIRQVDPALAEALHRWNGRKPFTVSSLAGLPRAREGMIEVRAGRECWLRVTTLGESIFQTFIQRFLLGEAVDRGRPGPVLQLGPLKFGVCEVLTTPASHPWAGYADALDLFDWKDPPDRLHLEFASPTRFNLGSLPGGGLSLALFPMPALVFGSLAARWREFVSPDLDAAAIEDAASDALVCEYRLRTEALVWKGRVQKGFCGRCTYDLRRLDPEARSWLKALADFAFYAGVGGKTTQGMGQARMVVG